MIRSIQNLFAYLFWIAAVIALIALVCLIIYGMASLGVPVLLAILILASL